MKKLLSSGVFGTFFSHRLGKILYFREKPTESDEKLP